MADNYILGFTAPRSFMRLVAERVTDLVGEWFEWNDYRDIRMYTVYWTLTHYKLIHIFIWITIRVTVSTSGNNEVHTVLSEGMFLENEWLVSNWLMHV